MENEFHWKKYIEKDKGPIVRWIATKLSNSLIWAEMKLLPYSEMWEVELADLDIPHNQMTLEDIDE